MNDNSTLRCHVASVIEKNGREKGKILGILLDLQATSSHNCIDKETTDIVAEELGMSATRVYEIATFYAMLHVKPQARYALEVCNSSPCYFSKSDEVVSAIGKLIGISPGQSTEDGLFSLQFTPCVGACEQGPVIKVGEKVHGNLDQEKIARIIEDLRESSNK